MTAVADVQNARRLHVDRAAIAEWTAENERARKAYRKHLAALAVLEDEKPCTSCLRDKHGGCNGRSGAKRAHRCLCWEMRHPAAKEAVA